MKPLLLFFVLLPVSLSAVDLAILGVLKPTELQIRLLDRPGILRTTNADHTVYPGAVLHFTAKSLKTTTLTCNPHCRFQVTVPGHLHRTYEGNLRLSPFHNTINVILSIEESRLLESVIQSEMDNGPEESLKAFTVVARSFLAPGKRHPERQADFCDTTHCQVYRALPASWRVRKAILDTDNLILTYHGKGFRPYYSRACGGKTASFAEIWKKEPPDYPFFSVSCPEIDVGVGSGHRVGFCQNGSMQLAKRGWKWQQILSHYFPQTELRYFESGKDRQWTTLQELDVYRIKSQMEKRTP